MHSRKFTMNDPFFSVIIPTFNRAGLIAKTIESVLQQQVANFELIVVDDGSTDNTREIVLAIHDERIIYREKVNQERAVARNFGVRLARGKYVTFLDSDDILYLNHLGEAKEKLEALGEPDVYHQGYRVIDLSGKVLSEIKLNESHINQLLFTKGNVMSCMGVFLKRSTALVNPFNENRDLIGVEDWELWMRLAGRFTIFHNGKITGAITNHGGRSVSRLEEKSLVDRMSTLITCVEGDKLVTEKYKAFRKILEANTQTYISLHLSESGNFKSRSFHYLARACRIHPGVLLKRRTLAIFRNILFRWN